MTYSGTVTCHPCIPEFPASYSNATTHASPWNTLHQAGVRHPWSLIVCLLPLDSILESDSKCATISYSCMVFRWSKRPVESGCSSLRCICYLVSNPRRSYTLLSVWTPPFKVPASITAKTKTKRCKWATTFTSLIGCTENTV